MGEPHLYNLVLQFTSNNIVTDSLNRTFGIRQVTSELTSDGYRLYRVNALPILIRGAGWSPDMFLRTDPVRQMQEFVYVRDMNLNAIR
jgi:exo-1,4-beta-D-glucosaminidase